MKIKKDREVGVLSTGDPISAANYVQRFQSFAALHGWFVIRNPEGGQSGGWRSVADTPAQWHAWMAWFARRAIPSRAARSHGVATVPCEWPEDFDVECPASDREWRSRPRPPATPQQRAIVKAAFAEAQETLGVPIVGRNGMRNFLAAAEKQVALEEIERKLAYWKSPLGPPPAPPRDDPDMAIDF